MGVLQRGVELLEGLVQLLEAPAAYEQAHIASAFVFELSKVEHVHVREAMVGHLRHVDEDLAKRVAAGLGFARMPDAPPVAVPRQEMAPSPALQIIGKMKDTLMGRAIGILIADGSDGAVGGVKLADGSVVEEGATALSMKSAAIDFVRDAFGHLKAIAVDTGGQALLKIANVKQDAGVVDVDDTDAFIAAAKTRQWDREQSIRTLP